MADDGYCGPALPPHLAKQREQKQTTDSNAAAIAGPALPPSLSPRIPDTEPAVPQPNYNSDSDSSDDDIGPMPLPDGANAEALDSTVADFEARARAQKEAILAANQPKAQERESWMTELPEAYRKNFGMEGRTFKQSYSRATMDKDGWTATPNDSKAPSAPASKSHDPEASAKAALRAKRNKTIEATVESYNSQHRGKSLMDIHAAKRSKEEAAKLKETGGKKQRRRFDPSVDVHGTHVSTEKRTSMIKKATQFQDRFSKGTFS
eukprot:TRINITY_DN2940_c0_g1_i1.p1 TRINITY_DN2940_c0_g1~~TRINITY_DN2940_c0_g1_i1.p1  ORF type:complete len:264 (+),score=37.55 TRINITY_DN2940_c0_g1_i1:2-793(+)